MGIVCSATQCALLPKSQRVAGRIPESWLPTAALSCKWFLLHHDHSAGASCFSFVMHHTNTAATFAFVTLAQRLGEGPCHFSRRESLLRRFSLAFTMASAKKRLKSAFWKLWRSVRSLPPCCSDSDEPPRHAGQHRPAWRPTSGSSCASL